MVKPQEEAISPTPPLRPGTSRTVVRSPKRNQHQYHEVDEMRQEEDHHPSRALSPPIYEDQSFTYSDDDSGSLSDAYFLPGPAPPRHPPDYPGPSHPPRFPSRASLTHSVSPPGVGGRLQSWAEGEDAPLQDTLISTSQRTGASKSSLTSLQYSSYGSVISVVSDSSTESPPARHPRQPPQGQYQYLSSSQRYRELRRKQKEQIAREQAVKQVRGIQQDLSCRDVVFAVLFILQLLVVAFAALRFGSGVVLSDAGGGEKSVVATDDHVSTGHGSTYAGKNSSSYYSETKNDSVVLFSEALSDDDSIGRLTAASLFTIDYHNVIILCSITGFYACVLSTLTVGFMLIIAKSLIQTALIFSVVLSLTWGVIGLSIRSFIIIPLSGFVALLLTLGYTVMVWDRIPFAATNLNTALSAMRDTADVMLVGLGMMVVTFAWCVMWSAACIGIIDSINTLDCSNIDDDDEYCIKQANQEHMFLYVALLFSFLWTYLVLKNIVQVTVARAIGTWWFRPEQIRPCCCAAVQISFLRAITTSLGPICFGSLVLMPAQLLNMVANMCCIPVLKQLSFPRQTQSMENGGEHEIISQDRVACGCLSPVAHFLRCCNRWSFTYIGMYGYGFLEGGEKAMQLFETREWIAVVSDNLIHNVSFMASIVIGGTTGMFGVLLEEVDGYTFSSFHQPIITAFLIGSVLGFVLSNILLNGVIGSSLNTVLVCFAAGPFEFHKNHPRLSQEMRLSWSQQVWEESPV